MTKRRRRLRNYFANNNNNNKSKCLCRRRPSGSVSVSASLSRLRVCRLNIELAPGRTDTLPARFACFCPLRHTQTNSTAQVSSAVRAKSPRPAQTAPKPRPLVGRKRSVRTGKAGGDLRAGHSQSHSQRARLFPDELWLSSSHHLLIILFDFTHLPLSLSSFRLSFRSSLDGQSMHKFSIISRLSLSPSPSSRASSLKRD